MHEGICSGGPLDGQVAQSRFDKGFLLIDKPHNQCWIYEWRNGAFIVRSLAPMPVLTEGPKNRFRAVEEFNYDVLAAPWVGAA